jgi:hypothetical protein
VVVAVGLTLVEPLADVDVKVPGVMEMLVAPDVAQLSVLLVPELMLVGLAVKELIVGAEFFPDGELDEVGEEQLDRPAHRNIVRTSAQRSRREELRSRGLNLFLQNGLRKSMRNPVVVGRTSLITFGSSCLLVAGTGLDC